MAVNGKYNTRIVGNNVPYQITGKRKIDEKLGMT